MALARRPAPRRRRRGEWITAQRRRWSAPGTGWGRRGRRDGAVDYALAQPPAGTAPAMGRRVVSGRAGARRLGGAAGRRGGRGSTSAGEPLTAGDRDPAGGTGALRPRPGGAAGSRRCRRTGALRTLNGWRRRSTGGGGDDPARAVRPWRRCRAPVGRALPALGDPTVGVASGQHGGRHPGPAGRAGGVASSPTPPAPAELRAARRRLAESPAAAGQSLRRPVRVSGCSAAAILPPTTPPLL